jgi:hypothetical protein
VEVLHTFLVVVAQLETVIHTYTYHNDQRVKSVQQEKTIKENMNRQLPYFIPFARHVNPSDETDAPPSQYTDYKAPPPYTPSFPTSCSTRPNLANLPLPLLFRIISLTLDQDATPSRWMSDREEERVRRVWALFRGLRGVCRSFWLGTSSIFLCRAYSEG